METVIYADVLFFINLIIDGLCIAVSMLVLGREFGKLRFALGCTIGGLYAVLTLYLPLQLHILQVTAHLLAAYVICAVAFKWRGFKASLINTVAFFFISALLGGILYAVYTLCGAFAIYNGAFYAELSAPALIASCAVIIAAISCCLIKVKTRATAKYAVLRFVFRGKECTVNCLCDSGNMLVCPYTALPVAVIGLSAAIQLFSAEELDILSETPVLTDVRPIPVSGIGGRTVLPSFVPARAEIKCFGKNRYKSVRVCIAIQVERNDFAGSDGILPPCLV